MSLFDRILLRAAREDAKRLKVKVPKWLVSANPHRDDYYEIWNLQGDVVWWGEADSAYGARAQYIGQLIDDH